MSVNHKEKESITPCVSEVEFSNQNSKQSPVILFSGRLVISAPSKNGLTGNMERHVGKY